MSKNRVSKFSERYGNLMDQNDYKVRDAVEDIISRSTVREYTDKPIPDELFQKLICAAQSSPTSSMAQAWSVISIRSTDTKNQILNNTAYRRQLGLLRNTKLREVESNPFNKRTSKDFQNETAIETCDRLLIWLVDMDRFETIYTDKDTGSSDAVKFDKPNAIRGQDLTHFAIRSIIDTAIAAQTFSLCAELEGLGVMYCGGFRTMDLKSLLNLPDRVLPLFGMTLGWPKSKNKLKPRLKQSIVVHDEQYRKTDISDLEEYNKLLGETLNYYNQYDWFDRMITRSLPDPINYYYRELAAKYGFKFE